MGGETLLPVLLVLAILAVEDHREQRIDGRWLFLPALLGLSCTLFGRRGGDQLLALLPGALMLLGCLCGLSLGIGDALTFLSLGLLLPPELCLRLALRTLLFAGLAGVWLWLRGGCRREMLARRLPLLPLVLTAWLLELGEWLSRSIG